LDWLDRYTRELTIYMVTVNDNDDFHFYTLVAIHINFQLSGRIRVETSVMPVAIPQYIYGAPPLLPHRSHVLRMSLSSGRFFAVNYPQTSQGDWLLATEIMVSGRTQCSN
jgi:hypothetical protein